MNILEELDKLKNLKESQTISEDEFLKLKDYLLKKYDEDSNITEELIPSTVSDSIQPRFEQENVGCLHAGFIVSLPVLFAWPVIFSNRYSSSNRLATLLWLIVSIAFYMTIYEYTKDINDYSYSQSTIDASPKTVDAKILASKAKKKIGFPAGMYHVGVDIPAGEYVLTAGRGYFQISKNSNGTFDAIVSNDNFCNRTIVSVVEGQYLLLNGEKIIPYDSVKKPLYGESDIIPEGMYKVGEEIPIGRYKILATGQAYYELSLNSNHYLTSIIANDLFEGQRYLTLRSGQYIKLRDAEMKKMPNKR